MATASNTKVVITGDTSGAVAAVNRLKGELTSLSTLSSKAFAFGGGIAGAAVVAGLSSITKQVIDTGSLNLLASRFGILAASCARQSKSFTTSPTQSPPCLKAPRRPMPPSTSLAPRWAAIWSSLWLAARKQSRPWARN